MESYLPAFNIFKIEHLCLRINIPSELIYKIIQNKKDEVNSFILKIPKEDGTIKERLIINPKQVYKSLLKKMNKVIVRQISFPKGICGSVMGRNLFDMVSCHCGQEAIYKLDIKDFFPNITQVRMEKMFLQCKCSNKIAAILSDLVSYNGSLPQGYPTSPTIANLIALKLDKDQEEICTKFNLKRTRWIDDIVFSGRTMDVQNAIPSILSSIKDNKFKLNRKKSTIVRRRKAVQIVGLILNKHKPYISPTIISTIKDYLDILENYGCNKLKSLFPIEFESKDVFASLQGKINYIKKFNPTDAEIRDCKIVCVNGGKN